MGRATVLVFTLWLVFAASARASIANIYYAPAAAGSNNGTSCANAFALTDATNGFNVAGMWGSGSTQIGAGTTVHICGGTYTYAAGSLALTAQGSGSSGNPITIQADAAATFTAPYWGPGSGGNGVINLNGKSFITLDGQNNLTLTATANGTNLANHVDFINGVISSGGSNVTIRNLTVSNMYVHACSFEPAASPSTCTDTVGAATGGISASGSNLTISGNTIHDSKDGLGLNYGASESNVTAFNNTIYNVDHGIEFGASTTGTSVTNVTFYGNDIHDFTSWDTNGSLNTFHHDCIHEFAYNTGDTVSGLYIYNNYCHGDFGYNYNASMFMESSTNTTTFYYFNNLIIDQTPSTTTRSGCGEICLENTGALVYNNTVYAPNGNGTAGKNDYYQNTVNENNIIVGVSRAVGLNSPAAASNTTYDYNDYWNIGSNGWNFASFAGWQATTCANGSCDGHGKNSNPNLDSNYKPQSGSPAIGMATNLTSTCSGQPNPGLGALCFDRAGNPRPTSVAWDAGAFQYRIVGPPPSPGLALLSLVLPTETRLESYHWADRQP